VTCVPTAWTRFPQRFSCEHDEVHVWCVSLQERRPELVNLVRVLNTEEIARANRFIKATDRDQYIACRAGLRLILSGYLDVSPEALCFRSDSNGKPRLESVTVPMALSFSVSHSEGFALYSVSRGRATGVDLERIRPHLASPWISERFFLEEDSARLKHLDGDAFVEGFFVYWTRMEAFLKACGLGLAGLGRDESEDRSKWAIYDLTPRPGYIGALTVEGQEHRLTCWDLEDWGQIL